MLSKKLSFFLSIFVILLQFEVKSQYFAPVGAEWYYKGNPFLSTYGIGYVKFSVEKDTVIEGFTCSKITGKEFYPTGDTLNYGPDFLRYDQGKVYCFRANDFRLMYDFTQNIGDTLEVFNYNYWANDSVSYLKVDTIYYKEYAGVLLKTYEYIPLENSLDIQYWGPVVERIGDLFWLYPQYGVLFDSEPGTLRCYVDSNMYYNRSLSGTTPCDEFWQNPAFNKIDENKMPKVLEIYPNPNIGNFTIALKNEFEKPNFDLFDAVGNKVYAENLINGTNEIKVSFLSSGVYYLKVYSDKIPIENIIIIIE